MVADDTPYGFVNPGGANGIAVPRSFGEGFPERISSLSPDPDRLRFLQLLARIVENVLDDDVRMTLAEADDMRLCTWGAVEEEGGEEEGGEEEGGEEKDEEGGAGRDSVCTCRI